MLKELKELLDELYKMDLKNDNKINNVHRKAIALECSIVILEKLRNEERSLLNGDFE